MALRDFLEQTMREPRPFSIAEAQTMASQRGLEAAVARRELTRVAPGHYASPVHSESWVVRSRTACEWMPPGSALTGRAALYAQGLVPEPPEVVDVVVPRGSHRRGPSWIRVVSQTHPIELVTTTSGLSVASKELALIHAFVREGEYTRTELVYGVCSRRNVDPGTVRELLDRLPRVGRRRELERLLDSAAAGIESFLEHKGASTVMTGAAFAGLVRQHRLVVRGEGFRVDAYDPQTRTAFEFDSDAWHGSSEQRKRDLRRDALLASVGILTVRFDYWDVVRRPQWCRSVAIQILAERAA